MSSLALILVLKAVLVSSATPADAGLVLHYDFGRAGENGAMDRTENHLDGAFVGSPRLVPCGSGHALYLDGQSHVDCGDPPALRLSRQYTIELWVKPDGPTVGEPGIAGKRYGSFALTYWAGFCCWYAGTGGNSIRDPLAPGVWQHVVGTFKDGLLVLYLDGREVARRDGTYKQVDPAGKFFLGTSAGALIYTKGVRFKGMLDEVRVYNRALSAADVRRRFEAGGVLDRPEVACFASTYSKALLVTINTKPMGRAPDGAFAEIQLLRDGAVIDKPRVAELGPDGRAEASIPMGDRSWGPYHLRAAIRRKDGAAIGAAETVSTDWTRPNLGPSGKGAIGPRNNLVTKLAEVNRVDGRPIPFENPRDGWVYVRSTAKGRLTIGLDDADPSDVILNHQAGGVRESMRFLPAGPHRLHVSSPKMVEKIDVRAVPHIVWSRGPCNSNIPEHGPYDWDFLTKYVLPNVNTIVFRGDPASHQGELHEWVGRGGRWLFECPVPGARAEKPPAVEEAVEYWTKLPGMADPLFAGLIVDEFISFTGQKLAVYSDALARIIKDPKYSGRLFVPYTVPHYGTEHGRRFMKTVFDAGFPFAFMRYLPEQPTEGAAAAYLAMHLRKEILNWKDHLPEAVNHLIVCLGYFSQPPESCNIDPAVDYKVWLDMQFHMIATDPAFRGTAGVMTYLVSFADEETNRWAAKLFRHYCIEGQTERLSRDPYILTHIKNPDFAQGLEGWHATP